MLHRILLRKRGTQPGPLLSGSSLPLVVRSFLLSYTYESLTVETLAVSAAFGLFLILCLLFSIQDMEGTIAAAQPVLQIFSDVFGQTGATVLFSLVRLSSCLPVSSLTRGTIDYRVCMALWALLTHCQLEDDVRFRSRWSPSFVLQPRQREASNSYSYHLLGYHAVVHSCVT